MNDKSTILDKKYEIKAGPPLPNVDEYIADCRKRWLKLLSSSPDEKKVQLFLEQHPMFLPGAWTPGSKSGHYPLHCAVVSQPKLPGLKSKIPDFMWIASHSLMWYPTLIEIERPSKQIFTLRGTPSAAFTQARNQLAEWRTWFSKPENVQTFIASYGIPDNLIRGRQMQLHMILIYGRRDECSKSLELAEKRGSLLTGADEELMSFDRLSPDRDLDQAITIRATGSGQYEAVHIPPTFSLGPKLADRLYLVNGIEDALKKSTLIGAKRQSFLISRIPYWQSWAKDGKSAYCPADVE